MFDRALLEEKLKDESFVRELLDKETAEDAQTFFSGNGIDLSLDEVRAAGDTISKFASGEIKIEDTERLANDELSEAELSEAAGGIIVTTGMIVGTIVVGAVGGTGIAIAAIDFFRRRW